MEILFLAATKSMPSVQQVQNDTIKQHFYLQMLRCLHYASCEQQQRWKSGEWQIHHDNAPAHSAQLVW
jgi:hypothetical protein